jgi:predicted oxidoreductase
MQTQPFGPNGVPVSRIALGCMGLAGTWDPKSVGPDNVRNAVAAFEAALDAGITFFDHADIYGGTACESIFRECLKAVPGARERIFIATKFGIRSGFYEHEPAYIRQQIHGSLERMGIDYVDLYQVHRPDPLTHPREVAAELDALVDEGLVRAIGVSNYYPQQTLALAKYLRHPVVSNQIHISLLRLDPIYEGQAGAAGSPGGFGDGVLDQCMELNITPLAYSPIEKGYLSGKKQPPADHPKREQIERTVAALNELSPAYDGATPTQLAVAWLLRHPAGIIPLVGSNNPEHIREFAAAASLDLSRADWYKLWVASRGQRVP